MAELSSRDRMIRSGFETAVEFCILAASEAVARGARRATGQLADLLELRARYQAALRFCATPLTFFPSYERHP